MSDSDILETFWQRFVAPAGMLKNKIIRKQDP